MNLYLEGFDVHILKTINYENNYCYMFLKDVGILEIPAELSARLRSAAGESLRFKSIESSYSSSWYFFIILWKNT